MTGVNRRRAFWPSQLVAVARFSCRGFCLVLVAQRDDSTGGEARCFQQRLTRAADYPRLSEHYERCLRPVCKAVNTFLGKVLQLVPNLFVFTTSRQGLVEHKCEPTRPRTSKIYELIRKDVPRRPPPTDRLQTDAGVGIKEEALATRAGLEIRTAVATHPPHLFRYKRDAQEAREPFSFKRVNRLNEHRMSRPWAVR